MQSKKESIRPHIRTCIEFRHPHWNQVILYLNNPPAVNYTTFAVTDGVILVTLCIGVDRSEENPEHVNLFIHMEIYSSKHEIQDGMTNFCM